MKKKILALLLVCGLVLTLAACGGAPAEESGSKSVAGNEPLPLTTPRLTIPIPPL